MKPHGEGEVLLEGPRRARHRHQEAKYERHPGDTPDVVVPPVGDVVFYVDVAPLERHL